MSNDFKQFNNQKRGETNLCMCVLKSDLPWAIGSSQCNNIRHQERFATWQKYCAFNIYFLLNWIEFGRKSIATFIAEVWSRILIGFELNFSLLFHSLNFCFLRNLRMWITDCDDIGSQFCWLIILFPWSFLMCCVAHFFCLLTQIITMKE